MSSTASANGDATRRRLTAAERTELVMRPLIGVFSSLSPAGWIHSVPVHFLYRDGQIRILGGTDSVKARNVEHAGRSTLCVHVADESDRRYVSVEGPTVVQRPATPDDIGALDRRYGRSESGQWSDDDYAASAILVLSPDRWIGWADWG